MKNITTNTANTTNDIGMIASLFGCAALSVALFANAFAAPAMPVQKMETIVVTANRLATVTLEPMVITAKRLQSEQVARITLAPMVITAQRITV
jgi:hypothetical protein